MQATLIVKHGRRAPELDLLFTKERERIERRLVNEPKDGVVLNCVLDTNPHCQEAYASLTLRLIGHTLNAHGVGPVLATALRDATDELLGELDRWRRHVRETERSRGALRMTEPFESSVLVDRLLESAAVRERADLDQTLRHAIPELHRFVRRELERHRAVLDRPELVSIEAADIVEETLVRALGAVSTRPVDVPFDRWLISCAYDVLLAEEDRTRPRRSLDDDIETHEPLEGETSAEEIVMRGQNGDAHWVADLIPNGSRAADEEASGRDVREAVLRAIRSLSAPARRVMSLVALEGLAEPEAARRLQCTEAQVHAAVEAAREEVRARLLARGVLTR